MTSMVWLVSIIEIIPPHAPMNKHGSSRIARHPPPAVHYAEAGSVAGQEDLRSGVTAIG